MKKLTVILTGLLSVQVVLAVILFSLDTDLGAFQSKQKLLGLSLNELDSINIQTADQALTLSKNNGDWTLPDHFNAPADQAKLKRVADKLFALNTSWPVATTEAAAPRFKVGKDEFERKVSFAKDADTLKTLYLGSSPGFKKIHARLDQESEVYSIDFSAFEVAVNADDWVDKNLLKLKKDEVTQVVSNTFSLSKTDQVWTIDNLEASKVAKQDKINSFLDKLVNLSYTGILGTETKPEYKLDTPVLSFEVSQKSNETVELQLAKLENDYVLKSSSQPYYFKLAQYQVQALLDASLDTLTDVKPAEVSEQKTGNNEIREKDDKDG